MRPVDQVAKLLEILDSKDGNSVTEFVSSLSAESILEPSYEGQTVLSLLVEALFPVAELHDEGVADDIVSTVRSFSRGLSSLWRTYFSVANVECAGSGAGQQQQGNAASEGSNASVKNAHCTQAASNGVVADIAGGIRVLAEKIEEERKLAELKGPEDYTAFLRKVTDYITRRNVSYSVCGGMRMASAANALALQYFSNTGDKEAQLLAMKPLREFLLGFSKYSLDPSSDVYPVHFALSMSGGANEDKFIEDVVNPLLQGVSREESVVSKTTPTVDADASMSFPKTQDSKGNTLLDYVLASPYCSAKTVGLVLKSFPDLDADPEREGSLSLVELLVHNIPRYAMFCSMLDAYRDYAEERANVASELRAATQAGDVAAFRKATGAKRELQYKMCYPSLEAVNRFDRILGVLCGKDRKIDAVRKANFLKGLGDNYKLCVMGILENYKDCLDEMRDTAKEDSVGGDSLMAHNVGSMISAAAKVQKIGAQAAADEVADVTLQDKGYVRRLGITAARARQAEACQFLRASHLQQEEKLSEGWVYDAGSSCSINRFFGVTCAMGKSAALHFEDFCKFYDIVFGAVHEIREKNKTYERIATNTMYCLAVGVPLFMIITNVVLIVYKGSTLKMMLVDTLCFCVALLTLAFVYVMDKDQRVVEGTVNSIEQDLKDYVNVFYTRRSVDILCGEGDALSNKKSAEVGSRGGEGAAAIGDSVHAAVPEARKSHLAHAVGQVGSWVNSVSVAGESQSSVLAL
ncbi:hypothetical protein ANPL_04370 [Anaplasma platys]|uniref:Uncharacterized protein n=1 Tax=Anaplasma platys TaxID=949 RepID=A0A858PZC9_9RICK|nr:hypothetical protein [Anaplasma platys]QJC27917.1 hypothetical protein ANPL_04370 [Anaplasma platys]